MTLRSNKDKTESKYTEFTQSWQLLQSRVGAGQAPDWKIGATGLWASEYLDAEIAEEKEAAEKYKLVLVFTL